jgi:CheY-like chemotaxis protein
LGRELDGKIILVVEDHSAAREAMASLLEDAGASVETAGTMQEAVDILWEASRRGVLPDAIVCDMRLPDGDGSELPQKLHDIDPTWHGPLVGISAYPESESAARQSGFDDFLPKLMSPLMPITIAHLFRLRPYRP